MSDYQGIAAYAVFGVLVFTFAMIWRQYREAVKRRFRLLNYHSKSDEPKSPHLV